MSDAVLLNRQEAALMLRVSVRTLYNLVKCGQIAVVRFGASIRFRPEDLQAFAAEKRVVYGEHSERNERPSAD